LGALWVAIICLTMIPKPKSSRLLGISSPGMSVGRWWITDLIGFSEFEEKVNSGDYFSPGRISWLNSLPFLLLLYGFHLMYFGTCTFLGLVTVAVRSEVWTVFAHSDAGIVGSNPT
jgi:hypothetical protein